MPVSLIASYTSEVEVPRSSTPGNPTYVCEDQAAAGKFIQAVPSGPLGETR